jgi:hypothetical protein
MHVMNNKSLIGKYLLEAFVGSVIFIICLRVSLIPVFFLKGALLQLLTMVVSVIFSAFVTYKAVRYVHRYL